MENSDKNYTGFEINFLNIIFNRENLTAQYFVSPYNKDSYYAIFMHTIGQIEPSSSDITIGVLPFDLRIMDTLEFTILYIPFNLS
jgi:hypothetical protein